MRLAVVVSGINLHERAQVARRRPSVAITSVDSPAYICETARRIGAAAVVVVLDALAHNALEQFLSDVKANMIEARVILRFTLTRANAGRLVDISARHVNCLTSLRGFDDLGNDLDRELRSRFAGGAFARIASSVAPVPEGVLPIVVAGAAIGWRRSSVSRLAEVCGVSSRTVEWQLAESSLVSAARLLRTMLLLHSAWCLDVLGWSVKRTAAFTGFDSRTGLSNFLRRQTGHSPRELIIYPGFEGLMRFMPQALIRR